MDPRRLPLNAVRAFEAAARHRSLSRAAEELGVTPGAIGHQVRLLEAHLGAALFRKQGNGLALTACGERALPQVQAGFAALAAAFAGAPDDAAARRVTVAVHPSFASGWLLPRLESFARRHPAVDVRVVGPLPPDDYGAAAVDLGIVYQAPRLRGLAARPLLSEVMLPVCSPSLLAARGAVADAAALLRLPLLHSERAPGDQTYPGWEDWARAAGVPDADCRRGSSFGLSLMAVQAALEGRGVALVSSTLVRAALAEGRLVVPLAAPPHLPIRRFLLSRRGKDERLAVRAFARWLLAAAAAEAA